MSYASRYFDMRGQIDASITPSLERSRRVYSIARAIGTSALRHSYEAALWGQLGRKDLTGPTVFMASGVLPGGGRRLLYVHHVIDNTPNLRMVRPAPRLTGKHPLSIITDDIE